MARANPSHFGRREVQPKPQEHWRRKDISFAERPVGAVPSVPVVVPGCRDGCMDKIDVELLKNVKNSSGARVSEVLALVRGLRSETQLRSRLNVLEIQGYVILDRKSEAGKVFVAITPPGREILGAESLGR
jgi:hypothetical protein